MMRSETNLFSPRVEPRKRANPMTFWTTYSEQWLAMMAVGHFVLGMVNKKAGFLATIHVWMVVLVGLYIVFNKNSKPIHVAYLAAYVVGGEVFWRMNAAKIFWEFGKYFMSGIFFLTLLRYRNLKLPIPMMMYLAFIMPAVMAVVMTFSIGTIYRSVSGGLSGLLAFFFAMWFFSRYEINREQMRTLLVCLMLPAILVSATALFGIVWNVKDVVWGESSNFSASGGFGPNQVSSAIGLGILASGLLLLLFSHKPLGMVTLFTLALWFTFQAALTFSRGGLLTAVVAFALASILTMNHFSPRHLMLPIVAGLLFWFLILPQLEELTDSRFSTRFGALDEKVESNSRVGISHAEYQMFKDNPILGVGLGEAARRNRIASHTEYSRLLAEHGMLGVFIIALWALMALWNFVRTVPSRTANGIVAACIFWAGFYMTHSAMRTAAPAFFFGLTFLQFKLDEVRVKKKVEQIIQKPGFMVEEPHQA